ncbi:KxYKxGKxW signal peptide domain-containing protein [Levilactobacillus zymae]|uniref:KxYKxGKxW signal peptide domain-containing protein n=1 Tax=Levilactobacillus zymae TaxID=267363 RepID=UPI003FCEDACE
METKRTHFKMYKDGRKWVFACALVLALGGGTTVAHADSNSSSDQSATSQVATGSDSSTSSQNTSTSSTANSTAKPDTTEGTTTQTSGATKVTTSGDDENGKNNANTNAVVESTKLADSSAVMDSSQSQQNQASQPDQKTDANADSTQPNQSSQQAKQFAQTAQNVSRTAKSTVPSGGSVYDDYPTLEDDNLLGVSSAFHIFARDAELNAHTNGNLAVQNLAGNVNFGTNIIEELLDKDISYIQNFTNLASSSFVSAGDTRENKVIFGEGITVDVSNPNRPKVNGIDIDHLVASEVYQDQNGQTYIDFDKEFEKLRNKNANFAAANSVRDYTAADFDDQNNRVIDVTDMTPDENGAHRA